MKKSQGFLLVVLIIFLHLFTILALCASKIALYSLRRNYAYWDRHQLEYIAEKKLTLIENDLDQIEACLIPQSLNSSLLNNLTNARCKNKDKDIQFCYVTELLADDPCDKLQNSNLSVKYYRISLLTQKKNMKMVIQSTVTIPYSNSTKCLKIVRTVSRGRQSYRELSI